MNLFPLRILWVLCSAGMLVSCSQTSSENQTDQQSNAVPITNVKSYLPLTKDFIWKFETAINGRPYEDIARVTGVKMFGSDRGVIIETTRGQILSLREAYQFKDNTLLLVAFSTSRNQWVTLKPPIPIIRENTPLGEELLWKGELQLNGKRLIAQGVSRTSAREPVQSRSAGRFTAIRVDTGITAELEQGDFVRYRTNRWLSPEVGFVKREYLDQSNMRESQLISFKR